MRDRHLGHFHRLATADGRKVMGSLDIGLRLRHDCPNITAAFEWAADHDHWITAGEVLTASWSAYYLDVRFSEFRNAAARTADHVAELDPDLHGCVTTQRFNSSILLADVAAALAAAEELTRSPLNNFRAIGWALSARLSAYGTRENVQELLAKSGNERRPPRQSDVHTSDAHAVAGALALFAHDVVALMNGDFERSRDLPHELVRACRTSDANIFVVAAAVSEILLGQPETALVTVTQLDEFDLPFMDGTEVRALAHLALGDTETALQYIRRLAKRAATGLYRAESDDAMLMLAALAHHHGDDKAARHFLLVAGSGRQPGTIAYGRHLARQLDIADDHETQLLDQTGTIRSMNALRTELTRRGWN